MPYMYSEMQNKLSKTRESPLESMGQIISSRCPDGPVSLISVQRYVKYCCITYRLQPGVKNVYKKNGHKPSRGQFVKSQKINIFIKLSCWIS